MPKAQYEKSIRITPKPAKKAPMEASFVTGSKQTVVKKPKSLTPQPKKK